MGPPRTIVGGGARVDRAADVAPRAVPPVATAVSHAPPVGVGRGSVVYVDVGGLVFGSVGVIADAGRARGAEVVVYRSVAAVWATIWTSNRPAEPNTTGGQREEVGFGLGVGRVECGGS